ncbi:MAG: hypothetical protein ACLFUO_03635 [Candidatus Woesearchaeota archaeon]
MKKRGQVTLFMIIGIVLLIVLFLAVQFRKQVFDIDDEQTVDITPSGFETYVERCLENTAYEAVQSLGSQAGYVDVPDYILNDPRSHLSLGNGVFRIPYWYYQGQSRIPSFEVIQEGISKYVQNNMLECFDNFTAFRDQYNVTIKSDPFAKATIGEEDIIVSLDYDIELTSLTGEEETNYEKFAAVVPVRLKKVYELAKDIMESENENFHFERALIDLMAIHPDIPMTSLEFSCHRKEWRVDDVKEDVKELLFYNMHKVRFDRTSYPEFSEDTYQYEKFRGYDTEDIYNGNLPPNDLPSDAYEYFNLFFDVTDESYYELSAGVEFLPQVDFEFRVRPNSNGIMKSSNSKGATDYLRFLCMQYYHFVYDVRFPLKLTIYDEKSFDGDGYQFTFAFPVIIKDNRPDRRESSIVLYEEPNVYSDPCESFEAEEVDIRAVGIFEGYDNVPLRDVNISYDCIKDGCYLGKTRAVNGEYKLVSSIPDLCTGGYITASADGYMTTKKQYAGEDRFSVRMRKVNDYNVKVMKKVLGRSGFEELDSDERVVLSVSSEKYGTSVYEEFRPDDDKQIELLAEEGDYQLDFMLISENGDNILGGYKGNWTYEYVEAAGSDTVVFYVLEYQPEPINRQQQYEMMLYLDDYENFGDELRPRFMS